VNDSLIDNDLRLVPASGFYEWKKEDGKVPYVIRVRNQDYFAMAGLYVHISRLTGSGCDRRCPVCDGHLTFGGRVGQGSS